MISALLGFGLASTLLILAPGPDSMLVMRNTFRRGRGAGWATTAGIVSGLLIWAVAAALGLSALLRASQLGYDILRLAGAAYLIWLGVSSLLSSRRKGAGPEPAADPGAGSGLGGLRSRHAYLSGLLSDLLNPKIGVFFVAFMPGFIPAGVPTAAFSLALGLWFLVETGVWLAILAWMTASGVSWLRAAGARRWMERLTGVVLIGFGIGLAADAS